MMAFRCPACLWPLSGFYRCRSDVSLGTFPGLPCVLRLATGSQEQPQLTQEALWTRSGGATRGLCPPQKAVPTWGDTQGPAPGKRWASGTQGVVFSLEALTLGGESTPGWLEAPGTGLQEEALEP